MYVSVHIICKQKNLNSNLEIPQEHFSGLVQVKPHSFIGGEVVSEAIYYKYD